MSERVTKDAGAALNWQPPRFDLLSKSLAEAGWPPRHIRELRDDLIAWRISYDANRDTESAWALIKDDCVIAVQIEVPSIEQQRKAEAAGNMWTDLFLHPAPPTPSALKEG
jgi:hypothetical protein